MVEEFKEDNNCIIKAFENNPIAIITEEIDNKKIYCFKANDIGKALKLSNIAVSIQSYDDDERVLRKAYDSNNIERDTTFLTSQGVYRLLYNSKKEGAKKFRKWAGNILDDIIFNESAELKRQLEDQKKVIEEKEKQLINLQKLKTKKWYDSEPGDTVYAIKIKDNLIKIGKTKKIKDRETHYVCDQVGNMFYIKKCYNCDLTEKVLHHILDKYRIQNNKEWFEISNELAIYIIDLVCDFLDKFIIYSEELPNSNIKENLNISLEIVKNLSNEIKENKDTNINIPSIKTDNIIIPYNDIEYETDKLQKFINECCDIDEKNKSQSYELIGAYRIWCKGLHNKSRKNFKSFFQKNYKSKNILYKEYRNSNILTYLGIQPKKIIIKDENIYSKFILSECQIGYTYRMKWTDFLNEYKCWINKHNPNYIFDRKECINLEVYINKYFLKDTINIDGAPNVPGIYGFQLKSDNKLHIGINTSIRKSIVKINKDTKEILEEYDYIDDCMIKLNISKDMIRKIIKRETIINNYFLKYKCDIL